MFQHWFRVTVNVLVVVVYRLYSKSFINNSSIESFRTREMDT